MQSYLLVGEQMVLFFFYRLDADCYFGNLFGSIVSIVVSVKVTQLTKQTMQTYMGKGGGGGGQDLQTGRVQLFFSPLLLCKVYCRRAVFPKHSCLSMAWHLLGSLLGFCHDRPVTPPSPLLGFQSSISAETLSPCPPHMLEFYWDSWLLRNSLRLETRSECYIRVLLQGSTRHTPVVLLFIRVNNTA